MWANCSGRSQKMSNHERFAQVAHQKWTTMSKSLRSLTKNERMSKSFIFFSKSLNRSFFCKKRAIRSENRWTNSQPWENSSKEGGVLTCLLELSEPQLENLWLTYCMSNNGGAPNFITGPRCIVIIMCTVVLLLFPPQGIKHNSFYVL